MCISKGWTRKCMQNQECTNHDMYRERNKATYITKEYIDELWWKISWGTRAWGWRVASFVEICSYVCMFSCAYWSHASNWTWNIQHSLWIQSTMHPARILKSCISVGLMNKNRLHCFPWDNQTQNTYTRKFWDCWHLRFNVVFHCWWSLDSEWWASLLYRFSWIFCKVFGIPIRLKFCILEAGPDSNACARSPDSDRKPDCPIVKAGTSCPIVRFMCLPDSQIQGWRQNQNFRQIRNKSPIVRISCVAQIVRPTRIKQRARLSESRFRVRFVWCH